MDIIFYKLQDEVNDVKKTRTLTATSTYTPLTIQGTLRGATSKVAPVIEFSKQVTYFNDYNYCYIADFKRYYFVTDVVSIRVGFTEIDLRVDVLTSFLTQNNIGNLEGYVGRIANPTYYSLETPDTKIQFKATPSIYLSEPTSNTSNIENVTFSVNPSNNIAISLTTTDVNDANIIAASDIEGYTIPAELRSLVGGATGMYGGTFRPLGNTKLYLSSLDEYVTGIYENIGTVDSVWSKIGIVLHYCSTHADAQSFVNTITMYPFSLPHKVNQETFYIADYKAIAVGDGYLQLYKCNHFNSGYLILKDFTLSESSLSNYIDNFSKYEPYTKCDIFIPYLGWINIDIKNNLNCRLMVIYVIDYTTGQANVFLYNHTKNDVIYQSSCMIGIQVPVTASNMRENEIKDQNYVRNLLSGLLSSGASLGVGIATYNPYLITAGGAGIVASVNQYINNESLLLPKQTSKGVSTSPSSGLLTGLKVLIKWTKLDSVNYYNETVRNHFISHLGLPCNMLINLSNIPVSGSYHTYAEIVDIHTTSESGLYSIEDITSKEVEELKRLCAEGIYL